MRSKSICIVNINQQGIGIGGTETVSYLLKNEFERNGYMVFSLFVNPKTRISHSDFLFPNNKRLDSEENLSFLISLIKEKDIDIVILQGGYEDKLMDICVKAKIKTGVKLVFPIHFNPLMAIKNYDDYTERDIINCKNPIIRLSKKIYYELKRKEFEKKTIRLIKNDIYRYDFDNLDAIITLCHKYTDFFQSIIPQQYHNRIHTITNPIYTAQYDYSQIKENIILFVGRLTSQKRLDRLMYIWNNVCNDFPTWKLVVVGDGDYSNEYKRISRNLGLMNIEFVGQQPSEEYFKKSKIVCMTSSHEALPMVLIEAQKYGCIPIAYNSFDAAEDIIKNGHNGLLIKPFKQKEYAKALSKLMTEESYRESLAANGSTFIEKFNIEIVIKDWIKLLESL